MSLLPVLRRDVLCKVAGEVISRLVFLLFFFYVARRLGAAEFGTLNLAISSAYVLGVLFLDPGLNLSTIQLLVTRPSASAQIAGSIFSLKSLLFVPMMAALWAVSQISASRLPPFALLFLAALFALFTALLEYLCSVSNAFHRMDLEAILKIFTRILIVCFGVGALTLGSVPAVLWGMWTATCLGCVLAMAVLRHTLISVHLCWDTQTVKQALMAGLPVAGTVIVMAVYLKWDMLVLSYFKIAREQIGWYAGAFKIVEAFSALPSMLGAALFPTMVRLREENPRYLDRMLRTCIKAVLLVSFPVAAFISVFSRQIVWAFYGATYVPGAEVLAVLIWSIVPIFLYFYLVFVNVAAGDARLNFLAGCIALLVGLTANALLIRQLGYLGAAWAALIANTAFAFLATWNVCRRFRSAGIPAVMGQLLAAGGLMMAAGMLLSGPPVLQFLVGLAVYVAALILLGALGSEDWTLAMRVLQLRALPQTR